MLPSLRSSVKQRTPRMLRWGDTVTFSTPGPIFSSALCTSAQAADQTTYTLLERCFQARYMKHCQGLVLVYSRGRVIADHTGWCSAMQRKDQQLRADTIFCSPHLVMFQESKHSLAIAPTQWLVCRRRRQQQTEEVKQLLPAPKFDAAQIHWPPSSVHIAFI